MPTRQDYFLDLRISRTCAQLFEYHRLSILTGWKGQHGCDSQYALVIGPNGRRVSSEFPQSLCQVSRKHTNAKSGPIGTGWQKRFDVNIMTEANLIPVAAFDEGALFPGV